jgi:hypothetical protein
MDVTAVLEAQDKASSPLQRVEQYAERTAKAIEKAQHATELLSHGFEKFKSIAETVGAAVGVGFGLHEFKEMFVDSNAAIEDATSSLGGLLQGLYKFSGTGGDPLKNLERSTARASQMMKEFEETSLRTGVPLKALAETAKALAPGMAATRTSTAQLADVTSKVALFTKMIGKNIGEGGQSMSMFLQYGISGRNSLVSQLGLRGRIYTKMTAEQRLQMLQEKLQKRITPETIKWMHEHETLNDKMQRVKNTLEIIAEKAGRPLFEKAAKAAGELADWLDKNEAKVKEIEGEIVGNLVAGFNKVVSITKFLSDHLDAVKGTILVISATLAATKIASIGASTAGGIAAMAGGGFAKAIAGAEAATALKTGASAMAATFAEAIPYVAIGAAIAGALYAAISSGFFDELLGIKHTPPPQTTESPEYAKAVADRVDTQMQLLFGSSEVKKNIEHHMKYLGKGKANLEIARRMEMEDIAARADQGGLPGTGLTGLEVKQWWDRQKGASPAGAMTDKGIGNPTINFNNARFDIMQQFAPGFDPDRIAVAFTKDLAAATGKKVQGTGAPHIGTTSI